MNQMPTENESNPFILRDCHASLAMTEAHEIAAALNTSRKRKIVIFLFRSGYSFIPTRSRKNAYCNAVLL